ncbi:MAG: hypothetical protein IPK89_12435 [Sphingomonadales bacterium]|nr:hypothetical protein [Sphingomonadales bacterium]
MKTMLRLMAVLFLPLALTSCFLIPGAFTSNLDLRKDGNFTFAYQGEIIFQSPDEMMKDGKTDVWTDDKANCSGPIQGAKQNGDEEAVSEEDRPCTKAEMAEKKKAWKQSKRPRLDKKPRGQPAVCSTFRI